MRFWIGIGFTDTTQFPAIARKAEECGFGGISVPDHIFMPKELKSRYPHSPDGKVFWPANAEWPDPWVVIGAMAAVTSKVLFTNTVYLLPARNLFVTAKAVGTAAVLSRNRVILGVGVGWMKEAYDQMREDFHTRGKRADELIEALRKLWRGGMVEHHGRFYDFDPLQISPAPSQPVPVWIGGHSEAALRRAARIGDGWIGNQFSLEENLGYIRRLKELRKEYGRERQPFDYYIICTDPLTPDLIHRLEDEGVGHLSANAFRRYGGDSSTLEAKERAMERFAEEFLQKV